MQAAELGRGAARLKELRSASPQGAGEGRPHLPAASLSRAVSASGLKAWVGAIKLTPSPRGLCLLIYKRDK